MCISRTLLLLPGAVLLVAVVSCGVATDLGRPPVTTLTLGEGQTGRVSLDDLRANQLTLLEGPDDIKSSVKDGVLLVEVPLGLAEGGRLLFENEEGLEREVFVEVVPLAFDHRLWSEETGPEAREHGALLVSDDGATIYLLSGGGYPNFPTQELLADAWQYDVAADRWDPWDVSGDVPPPAGSRRVARLTDNQAILFGGYVDDFDSDDVLVHVDLVTGVFTTVTPSTAKPASRTLHAMAYDDAHDRVIVFGGFSQTAAGNEILNDTWFGTFDKAAMTMDWQQQTLAVSPPPRYGAFAGVDDDEDIQRFVVYSGAGTPTNADPVGAITDAWVLTLGDTIEWQLLPADDTPVGRRNGCGVVDPSTHTLTVFGGTADARTTSPGVFVLDVRGNGTWHAIEREGEPLPRSSSFGAALPGGGIVCGFGNDDDVFLDLFFLRSDLDG